MARLPFVVVANVGSALAPHPFPAGSSKKSSARRGALGPCLMSVTVSSALSIVL